MTTISFRFPGGRYHATPFGDHVNEGHIEWPPSPWRILRALISVGYTSGVWNGTGPTESARELIESLASVLPAYRLPPAVGTHSRHYMPTGTIEKGRERTTLVFDTWAQVDDGELVAHWDIELQDGHREILAALLRNLGYLGRSESWVDATLWAVGAARFEPNCVPDEGPRSLRPGYQQIALLVPERADDYLTWRAQAVPPPPTAKKPTKAARKKHAQTEEDYPLDLVDALQRDSRWLRDRGWSQPPGSRRAFFWRRDDALEIGPARGAHVVHRRPPVEAVLLALTSTSGNNRLLPRMTRTLAQAELLHAALVSHVARAGALSTTLTGQDHDGRPSRAGHRHAHILPDDLDADEHIDHVLLWAPMGFDSDAQDAIRAVRRTFTKGGAAPIRVAIAAMGGLEDLRGLSGDRGARLRSVLAPAEGATRWQSRTPFVPPRHLKPRGRNTLAGQVASELQSRGFPVLTHLEIQRASDAAIARNHRHYVRRRRRGRTPPPPQDTPYTLLIELAEPHLGPLSLGYASHFGLGSFEARLFERP